MSYQYKVICTYVYILLSAILELQMMELNEPKDIKTIVVS